MCAIRLYTFCVCVFLYRIQEKTFNMYHELLCTLLPNVACDTVFMKFSTPQLEGITVNVTDDTLYWFGQTQHEGKYVWKYKTTFTRDSLSSAWIWEESGSVNCFKFGTRIMEERYLQEELLKYYAEYLSTAKFWDDIEVLGDPWQEQDTTDEEYEE